MTGQRFKYPVAFLTNSGGYTEDRKADQLTDWLGVPITASQVSQLPVKQLAVCDGTDECCCVARQVVLSHSPFRPLASRLGDRPVLVCGRNETPAVAAAYGCCLPLQLQHEMHGLTRSTQSLRRFREAVTTAQLGSAYLAAVPFSLAAGKRMVATSSCAWHAAWPVH